MNLSGTETARLEAQVKELRAKAVPFAMATVVRTLDSTSAKPGSKAIIDQDGRILMGWVGGGCARGAVSKAALEAISDGLPKFISLRPQDVLESAGVEVGENKDGIRFERNGCPSKGTMDFFIEPILPMPNLVIFGDRFVANALVKLGGEFDFTVNQVTTLNKGSALVATPAKSFVVVATQGKEDFAALMAAVNIKADYVGFVGSKEKFATLAEKLTSQKPELKAAVDQVHSPAGLAINAITPEEIALSIFAQITQLRRCQAPSRGGAND